MRRPGFLLVMSILSCTFDYGRLEGHHAIGDGGGLPFSDGAASAAEAIGGVDVSMAGPDAGVDAPITTDVVGGTDSETGGSTGIDAVDLATGGAASGGARTGGATGGAGAVGTGGSTGQAGTSGSGGGVGSGGMVASGGVVGTGGAIASGGSVASGGAGIDGGAATGGTGGTPSGGGSSGGSGGTAGVAGTGAGGADACGITEAGLPVNVALGKPAAASRAVEPAEHAIDGDMTTAWNAGGSGESWWMVDLQQPYRLTYIDTYWEMEGLAYKYYIEVSTNGVTYDRVVDRSENSERPKYFHDEIPDGTCGRLVRVTMLETAGYYAILREVRVVALVPE
jgi:hypothetical protein